MRKSISVSLLFAVGHGMMLFLFATLFQSFAFAQSLTHYGDTISSVVIISMGVYLLFMVLSDCIQLNRHVHEGKEHLHIYFGAEHSHNTTHLGASAWSMGALMGIGGVRGMLVTLGLLHGSTVSAFMIVAFVAGVSLVFLAFGAVILLMNKKLLHSRKNVRRAFAFAGTISIAVGIQMLMA